MAVENPEYIWNLKTQPSDTYAKGSTDYLFLPSGKVVGGSGSINGMLYHRGNDLDYNTWEALGNDGWGWKDVKPYFKKSLSPGGLVLGSFENFNPFMDTVERGARELGQNKLDKFDEGQYIGYARAKVFASNGRRMNSGKVYLSKAKDRKNLHVVKSSIAKKIHFSKDNERAEFVEFVYKEQETLKIKARKEVILSAGTIGTAKLLLLSGIGPTDHLNSLEIPLVKNLSVGHNYQDHVRVPLMFSYRDDNIDKMESLNNLERYLLYNEGPLTSRNMIFLMGFINSDPKSNSSYPDLQFSHFTSKDFLPSSGYYQVDTLLLMPKSRGSILLASKDYLQDPLIYPNYFYYPEDMDTVIRGLKYQLQFKNTKAFRYSGASIINFDIPECNRKFTQESDDYLKCYVTYMSANCYHTVGTAKMGPATDPDAVVDNTLKVYGIAGLRIGDNSIMPNIVSGNTNAAAIMIAEKLADFVKSEYAQ